MVPVRGVGLGFGEDHPGAFLHPAPEPEASARQARFDVLQRRGRGASCSLPGPPDDLGAPGREAPEAQEPAHTVQGSALAVSVAHTLNGVAGSEGHEVVPSCTLQETLVADLPHASEPGSQEGVSPGSQ